MNTIINLIRLLFLPLLALPGCCMLALVETDSGSPAPAPEPFKTHLVLSDQQKAEMTQRAARRISELMDEMGLETEGRATPGKWMELRIRNQATYDNDLEWRKAAYGGVFVKSNLSRGVTRRFAREMSAKVSDDMVGTTPFFGAVKRLNGTDAALARAVEDYSQIEVERSNLPQTIREAQRSALVRNEAVVKVRHIEDSTFFVGSAKVMVGETGEPVVTATKQFIYEDDDFISDPSVEDTFRLKKDPSFEMREGQFAYAKFPALRQETIRKRGIEAHVLDPRSFLCPLTAPTIHDADIVVQMLDMSAEKLKSVYGEYESYAAYCAERTSGEEQPKTIHGEPAEGSQSDIVRTVRIAECYMRADVDGDGYEEEIFLVMDMGANRAVFYDYLDNHFHKRPFEVIVGVEGVPNRWYGVGIIQMLWDQNIYVDTQFARINLKDSRESSITFADEMAVKEWKGNSPIKFGTDYVYRVEPGYDPATRPPIWRWNGNEVSELGERLMATVVQDMTTTFGVISAKDASTSNLNNSRTATGIMNMERTANILTRYTELAQQTGVEALLKQAVVLVLENMPPMAMFFSKDGETLHSLNKTEARAIERDVRLFLTRARSTESLALNERALLIAKDYHAMLLSDPRPLLHLRPLYVAQLKALEVGDADEMLPMVDEDYIAQWQQEQAAAAQQQQAMQNQPPKELLNYKDAPPSVKAQMERDAGYEPAEQGEHIALVKPGKAVA